MQGLLRDAPLLDDIVEVIAGRDTVTAAKAMLEGGEPDIAPGDHCSSPHECEFAAHCRQGEPEGLGWPVTVLPRGAGRPWHAKGYESLLDVPKEQLKGVDARVQATTVSRETYND